jgi:alkylated DNA nucleotide flippase Atl1
MYVASLRKTTTNLRGVSGPPQARTVGFSLTNLNAEANLSWYQIKAGTKLKKKGREENNRKDRRKKIL